MVELVRSGRAPGELTREYECSAHASCGSRQIHSDFGHQLSALDDGPAAVVGVLAGVGPPDVAAIVRPIGVPLDSGAGHGVIRA